ncbi:MAG: family 78 glycoside hydrolase catalytic domain [Clostridia bacterium]|nr:family 78 glycoside hydrolase catalytic domain [Clostridia bacterium]
MFKKAKWIWVDERNAPNTYGEFYDAFQWNGEKTVCRISCDGDYTLYVNGQYVESNQYGDYEWYKSVDTVDVTPYLKKGENSVAVLVWYFGEDTQRYLKANAGLIYEVEENGQLIAASDENTLSRYSRGYQNGGTKTLTPQLGFSYVYDANKEDGWLKGELQGFTPSVLADKHCNFVSRPNQKLKLLAPKKGKLLEEKNGKLFVFDLGEETVGLFSFKFQAKTQQTLLISYGEDLENGRVRRIIPPRDFSVEYIAKEGKNEYVNYMLRFGCRYIQIESEDEISIEHVSLIPQIYPTAVKSFTAKTAQDQAIYDLCVRSLQLCMMEHYVDCPWREQCLYAFDSRNQMLCGYYAFEDGNFEYVRSNLLLMSKDKYPSGLMAICYPCGADLTIPSFSLYYTLSVLEYTRYSKDLTLAKEVFSRIQKYLDAVLARMNNGLLYRFEGEENWNFYDWSQYSEGTLHGRDVVIPDAQLNILTVMALRCLKELCALAGLQYPYGNVDVELAENILKNFYNKEKKVLSVTVNGSEYVELVNALAVSYGLISGTEAEIICEKLTNGELLSCSLSMKCFTYDALLKVNEEKYREWILADIRKNYQKMLDSGATATWETIDGAIAFEHAGSLCHGWTAIPIYYFNRLGV